MMFYAIVLLINVIAIGIAVWTLWSGASTGRLVFPRWSHGGLVTRADRPRLFWTHMIAQLGALVLCSYLALAALTRLVGGDN